MLFVGLRDINVYLLVIIQRNEIAVESDESEHKSEGESKHAYYKQMLGVGHDSSEYIFEDIDLSEQEEQIECIESDREKGRHKAYDEEGQYTPTFVVL
jgi:hypothetical protein